MLTKHTRPDAPHANTNELHIIYIYLFIYVRTELYDAAETRLMGSNEASAQ